MRLRRALTALAVSGVLVSAGGDVGHAQTFYEGKIVRINVGFAAGGGYDTYARLLSRHLGRHIPGNPTLIVDNMPGAGSLIAANHLYRVAKPDGLTLAHYNGVLFLGQVLGQPGIEFDSRKFELIGAAVKEDVACAMTKASGITSLEKWMAAKTPVKLGGVAPGAAPDNTARILKAALGLPIQLVSGYKGTADIRLAAEAGEVAGACWAWDSMKVTWRQALDAGDAVPVLQVVAKKFPDLPNVPLAITFAKTDEARQLIQVGVQYAGAFARPFAVPPGTPKERVQALRRAFQETLRDNALVAEAEKTKLTLDPVTGEELEKMVADVFTLDPALAAKLKAILYN
jgi:tripartite-type tricarboxylate transporter receptor subunit TctC